MTKKGRSGNSVPRIEGGGRAVNFRHARKGAGQADGLDQLTLKAIFICIPVCVNKVLTAAQYSAQ